MLDLYRLAAGYELCARSEGKSENSIKIVLNSISYLGRFLAAVGASGDVSLIGPNELRGFILYLQSEAKTPRSKKPLSPATVQGYVRTLKSFFSWAVKEEYLSDSPTAKIPVPKAPVKVINTFQL